MPSLEAKIASAAEQSVGSAVGIGSRYEISDTPNSFLSPEGDIELHQSKSHWSLDVQFDLASSKNKRRCLDDNRSDPRALDRCGRVSYYDAVVRSKSDDRNQSLFFAGNTKLPLFSSATLRTILPFAWNRFFSPLPEVNPAMGGLVQRAGIRFSIAATNDVTTGQGGEFSATQMQPLAILSLEADVAQRQVVRLDICSYDLNHSRLVRGDWASVESPELKWEAVIVSDERKRRFANQSYVQTIQAIIISATVQAGQIEWQFDSSVTKFHSGEICESASSSSDCRDSADGNQSEYQLGASVPFVTPLTEHARFSLQFGSFVALDHFTPSEAICSSGGCGRRSFVRGMWTFKI